MVAPSSIAARLESRWWISLRWLTRQNHHQHHAAKCYIRSWGLWRGYLGQTRGRRMVGGVMWVVLWNHLISLCTWRLLWDERRIWDADYVLWRDSHTSPTLLRMHQILTPMKKSETQLSSKWSLEIQQKLIDKPNKKGHTPPTHSLPGHRGRCTRSTKELSTAREIGNYPCRSWTFGEAPTSRRITCRSETRMGLCGSDDMWSIRVFCLMWGRKEWFSPDDHLLHYYYLYLYLTYVHLFKNLPCTMHQEPI